MTNHRESRIKEIEGAGSYTLFDNEYFYEGSASFMNQKVSVYIRSDKNFGLPETSAELLKKVLKNAETYEQAAKEYAADDMLEIVNKWSDDGDISREEFMERIQIVGLLFNMDRSFELSFSDDGMLDGHIIEVCFNSDEKCFVVRMEG